MTFRARVSWYDETKQRIIDAYESAAKDGDVEVDELKVSLICATSKTLVKTPVRSTTCTHLQCFDFDNFIGSNANIEQPKCPICNVDINTSKLVVDEYFQSVLSVAAKENASEVELLCNGHFRFPRPAGSSVSTSVAEDAVDPRANELEEGEVVDTDDSVRSVEKKTEPNGTGAPRRRGYIPCDICGKRCRREKDLNEHKSRVHLPQIASIWTCTICSERFYNETARNNHEDTAHGEKAFKCNSCEKQFGMRTARTMHMRTCTRKKKAVRKKCGRRFADEVALASHKRVQHKIKNKKTLEGKKKKWTERYLAIMQKCSTTQATMAAPDSVDIEKAASTPTSAPLSRKKRRLGLKNPPRGHCAAPTTVNRQPMKPALRPVSAVHAPRRVPTFPPMMPPPQPLNGFYCPPPYHYGPVPLFPPPYHP